MELLEHLGYSLDQKKLDYVLEKLYPQSGSEERKTLIEKIGNKREINFVEYKLMIILKENSTSIQFAPSNVKYGMYNSLLSSAKDEKDKILERYREVIKRGK